MSYKKDDMIKEDIKTYGKSPILPKTELIKIILEPGNRLSLDSAELKTKGAEVLTKNP
jgi:hypothetical protein